MRLPYLGPSNRKLGLISNPISPPISAALRIAFTFSSSFKIGSISPRAKCSQSCRTSATNSASGCRTLRRDWARAERPSDARRMARRPRFIASSSISDLLDLGQDVR